jgi:hypothetical protein
MTPQTPIWPPIEGFQLEPSFLVELGCDSMLGDLVRLWSQVLGHSIPLGCFTSSPNLSSRAQAVWEIHGWIGEVDFSFWSSARSVRGLADRSPVAHGLYVCSVFIACSCSSCEFACGYFEVSKFCCKWFGGPSTWRSRTVRAAQVALEPSAGRVRTVSVDCPPQASQSCYAFAP